MAMDASDKLLVASVLERGKREIDEDILVVEPDEDLGARNLDTAAELGVQVLLSTHFLDFVARLAEAKRPGVSYLRVEQDEQERPTFRFVPGVARSSLARATAARLGVTSEELRALLLARRSAATAAHS